MSPNAVICVFCGASDGTSPAHLETARALAKEFHKNSITLVYGGGTRGIMGEVAKTLVSLSGPDSVHGIIPKALMAYEQGTAASDASLYGRVTIVADMHTRKQMMAQEVIAGGPGSGFIALSGGYGTLEELAEVTTWNQLGIHSCGVAVLNVDGYWDGLLAWIKTAVKEGFIKEINAGVIINATDAESVVLGLKNYVNTGGQMKLDWKAEGESEATKDK
jgi:uncharacterized protein (TIGR00730 family)